VTTFQVLLEHLPASGHILGGDLSLLHDMVHGRETPLYGMETPLYDMVHGRETSLYDVVSGIETL